MAGAGGALGAALVAYHRFKGRPRTVENTLDAMKGSYLGPSYDQAEIERRLTEAGADFTTSPAGETIARTARARAQFISNL